MSSKECLVLANYVGYFENVFRKYLEICLFYSRIYLQRNAYIVQTKFGQLNKQYVLHHSPKLYSTSSLSGPPTLKNKPTV